MSAHLLPFPYVERRVAQIAELNDLVRCNVPWVPPNSAYAFSTALQTRFTRAQLAAILLRVRRAPPEAFGPGIAAEDRSAGHVSYTPLPADPTDPPLAPVTVRFAFAYLDPYWTGPSADPADAQRCYRVLHFFLGGEPLPSFVPGDGHTSSAA